MWKHEILENASCWGHPKPLIDEFNDALEKSVVVYFGDIKNIKAKKESIKNFSEFPKIPFQSTLVEFLSDNVKNAFLVFQNEETTSFISYLFNKEHFYNVWLTIPIVGTVHNKTLQEKIDSIVYEHDFINDNTMINLFKNQMDVVATLINVLNAKNIVTKEVLPPSKLNKARLKRRKKPLYSYHILEVVKGIPKNKYLGKVPCNYHSPENTALHLCRGHFKTYTEDAPLFGKYSGTFWWQPSVRGNAENGIVDKDYSVKVASA